MSSSQKNKITLAGIVVILLLSLPAFILLATVQQNLKIQAGKKDLTCGRIAPDKNTGNSTSDSKMTTEQLRRTHTTLASLVKQYRARGGNTDQNTKKRLRDTANNRKRLLTSLIKQNPEAALDFIQKNRSEEKSILDVTAECGVTPTTVEGTAFVAHADYDDNRGKYFYSLTMNNRKKLNMHVTSSVRKPIRSGSRMQVTGYRIGDDFVVNGRSRNSIRIAGSTTATSVDHAQGEQETVVIITDVSLAKETVDKHIFETVNDYYKNSSYGKISLSGDTYGPYSIADAGCDEDDIPRNSQDIISAADEEMNFSGVKRIVIFGQFSCGWGGYGLQGPTNIYSTHEGNGPFSVAWVNSAGNNEPFSGIAAHELGHNFDIDHAVSFACGTPGICGEVREYGNTYSVMGGFRYLGQLGAPHRDHLGWFDPEHIQTVNKDGTYTIGPIENNDDELKALKIPRGGSDYMYVEYRQPIGTDENFAEIEGTNVYNGALLQVLQDGNPKRPAIFDSTEPSGTPVSMLTAALLPGEEFTDPATGTIIRVTDADTDGVTVEVSYKGPDVSVAPQPTKKASSPTPDPCILTPTPDDTEETDPPDEVDETPEETDDTPEEDVRTPRTKTPRVKDPERSYRKLAREIRKRVGAKKPSITVTVPTPNIRRPKITVTVPTPRPPVIRMPEFPDWFPFRKNAQPDNDKIRSQIPTPRVPKRTKVRRPDITVRRPSLPDTRQNVKNRLREAGIQSADDPCN